MTISVRAAYTWDCERCGQERHAPVWRIVDARERADVLVAPDPGVSWLDCPVCGTREHIEAPLLVLRPGAVAPMLLAVSVEELQGGAPPSAPPLLEEAERAGAFRGGGFFGQVIPLPRRLLPFALTRDVERDLTDPEEACRQLRPEGGPTVTNYRTFLGYLAEDADHAAVRSLLRLVTTTAPDQLAQLVVEHPQLTCDTRVRDAGREELRAAAGAPLEAVLRMRQRLLDELCDGRTPQEAAIRNYFESQNSFGAGLRERLYAMYREARTVSAPSGIPLVRDALTLAAQIGEERIETELAARLGTLLVEAVRAGLDADLSEALRVLELALGRLPEGGLQWAEVAGNLAAAHHERDDGDRMEIWATACDLLSRAAALDRREHPEMWARIQTNYGLLLAERPGGGPEDLVLGIARIRAGLEERSPERDRVNWAYSMLNLGLLLQCLHRGAGSDHRSQAEECYRQALGHLDADDDPALWSQLQCNLADVLLARDPADVRGAIRAATSALDLRAARSYTFGTARLTWVLARATARLEGPDSVASRRLYRAALAAAPPEVSPSLHISMARELLHTHASAERWIEAADVATDMLTAVNALFDAQVTTAGRRSVLVQLDRLARWAAYLLARAGRPERAVEAIERGLACELSVVTGRGAVDLAELERIDPATARRYRRAHARYRTSVAQPPSAMSDGPAPVTEQQAAVERELRSVVEEIRAIPGFERFLRTAEIADIFRACGGMPLAYLVTAPWGGYVLTLPGTSAASGEGGAEDAMPPVLAVPVPEVSSVTVLGLLVMETGDGEEGPGRAGLLLVQAAGALRRRRASPRHAAPQRPRTAPAPRRDPPHGQPRARGGRRPDRPPGHGSPPRRADRLGVGRSGRRHRHLDGRPVRGGLRGIPQQSRTALGISAAPGRDHRPRRFAPRQSKRTRRDSSAVRARRRVQLCGGPRRHGGVAARPPRRGVPPPPELPRQRQHRQGRLAGARGRPPGHGHPRTASTAPVQNGGGQRLPIRPLRRRQQSRPVPRAAGRLPPGGRRLRGDQPVAGERRGDRAADDPLVRSARPHPRPGGGTAAITRVAAPPHGGGPRAVHGRAPASGGPHRAVRPSAGADGRVSFRLSRPLGRVHRVGSLSRGPGARSARAHRAV